MHREFKELRKTSEHNMIVSTENFVSPNSKPSSPDEDFDHYMLNHNNHDLNPNNFELNEEESLNKAKNNQFQLISPNPFSNLESELFGEISKLDDKYLSRKRSSILFNNNQMSYFKIDPLIILESNSSKFKLSSLFAQVSIIHKRKSHKKNIGIGRGITLSFIMKKSRKLVDPLREYFILVNKT